MVRKIEVFLWLWQSDLVGIQAALDVRKPLLASAETSFKIELYQILYFFFPSKRTQNKHTPRPPPHPQKPLNIKNGTLLFLPPHVLYSSLPPPPPPRF